jgi:two-component system OmpR family response regulator
MTALLRVRSLDRARTGGASLAPPAQPDPAPAGGRPCGLDVGVVGHGSEVIASENAEELRSRGHRVTDTGCAGRPEVLLVAGAGGCGDLAPFCRTVRAAHPATAVMALGGGGVDECVAALEAGMDDYVAYPCTAAELESRMRAVLRRRRARPVERLALDDLVLEPSTMSAWRAGRPLDLTTGEFRVLEALLRNPNRVMDRGELHRATGSARRFMASRTVDVCIHSLRQKVDRPFGRDSIATIRGVGYRLRVARPAAAD